jgi:leucyl aminopeptidase
VKVTVKSSINYTQKSDALVLTYDTETSLSKQYPEIDDASNGLLATLQKTHKNHLTKGKLLSIPSPAQLAQNWLILIPISASFNGSAEEIRSIFDGFAKEVVKLDLTKLLFDFSLKSNQINADPSITARHLVEALEDANYVYVHQPKSEANPKSRKDISLSILCQDRKTASKVRKGSNQGLAISRGKEFAKNVANMPGNVCTPSYLASQARKLSKTYPFKVKVLSEKDMSELGMGSLLSVSKGSREPAKLITISYTGAKNKKEAPHALVGKGLTFDAGGISIKPSGKMDEMKYDMCGSASVFGALIACAELELPINVVGVIPSSENLPDGQANKPGDIVTSMAGKTIEILNTDAEGRLILCDALTYTRRFKPQSVIDIATLTGAVIVALGHQTAGLMGNDQDLVDDLLEAGEESLDTAWQLPLKETYKNQLKSRFADLANIGGPSAGTITAAAFLSCFTEGLKWAHLDIAGTAWGGKYGKQASGRAVPILTQYLINKAK